MAASTVSSWVPPPLPESAAANAPGLVLLDRWCYIADLPNTTTAESTTSRGSPIKVTFRAARPPLVSHFCVHCPGLEFRRIGPKIVATDADLVLLRVPVIADTVYTTSDWDYFVYRPRAQQPWLHLLPNPSPRCFNDSATALISRDDGAWYAVAALSLRPPLYDGRTLVSWDFDLHLYRSRSRSESKAKRWISKRLSVDEFERDNVIPVPPADDSLYHETGKTITVGGEHGTVAWVDLWRGIFFCDVLKKRPRLRDVPLPVPMRGNWLRLLRPCDHCWLRDVTVSRNRDSIKYVELELWSPPPELLDDDATPVSYADWVRSSSGKPAEVLRDGWKSTTWNMAIPVGSPESGVWHSDCVVDVEDITLEPGDTGLAHRLATLSSKTPQTLKELQVACPILSMDDDVVYLLSGNSTRDMLLAIDVRKATLLGLAELDAQKSTISFPNFLASEICRGT